jgi:hypothetical protein
VDAIVDTDIKELFESLEVSIGLANCYLCKAQIAEIKRETLHILTEAEEAQSRLGWLMESFNIDWDDAFEGYEDDWDEF